MKNDKLHKRIEIHTNNNTNYLELAILLDKPEFLNLLPILRNDYGISKLIDLKNFDKTIKLFQNGKKYKLNLSKYKNAKQIIEYAHKNNTGFEDIQDEMDLYQLLDTETNLICYFFKRPSYFAEPIKQAILCNEVNDSCFEPTAFDVIEHDTLLSTAGSFQLPRLAILISPTSTDMNIEDAVYEARKLYKTDSRLRYYKPRTNKSKNIRAYRDWYWSYLNGKRYVDIANEWSVNPEEEANNIGNDDNRIMKGVRYYQKLLTL